MQKNKNRSGYKETKMGWIPATWSISQLSECAKFLDNQRIPLKQGDREVRSGAFPYYGASGIIDYIDDYVFDDDLILLGEDGANILFRASPLAFRASGKFWVNNHAHVLKPSEETSIGYLCEFLESISYVKYNTGTAQPKLNRHVCGNIPVLKPPLFEQKTIAGVLETWDRGICQLEAKIDVKRRVKKGLMQELLSGKRRLPGFGQSLEAVDSAEVPRGWKQVKLGDVFRFLQSHAFSRDNLTTNVVNGATCVFNIHYGDIHATYQGPLLDLQKEAKVPRIKAMDQLPARAEMLKEGDLVMADASEDHAGVGACVELINLREQKVTGGLHTFVLRDDSNETAIGFRGYLFQEYQLAKELKRISTGASVYGISKTNLAKILLTLPPLEEQKACVNVLNAADRELDALQRKLANWKVQKKYLLNNLVDGTIRLPEFIEAEAC
jgi:type I restriction enzyme S subunit